MARSRSHAVARVQLGPYWLEYRAERNEWCICWYDTAARTRRRRTTGVRGGRYDAPPDEAREALAAFYLEESRPAEPQAKASVLVPELFTHWLRYHVLKLPRDGDAEVLGPLPARSRSHTGDFDVRAAGAACDGPAKGLAAADRYGYSVKHWLRFFDYERSQARLADGATVADVNGRFIDVSSCFANMRVSAGTRSAATSRRCAVR